MLVGASTTNNPTASGDAKEKTEKEDAGGEEDLSREEDITKELELIKLCFSQHEFGIFPDAESPGAAFDFDPLKFISEKLEHGVSLDVIHDDLTVYSRYLEEKIMHLVNTEVHAAFVQVSGHFVGMAEEVQYLQRPLGGAHTTISEALASLNAIQQEMNEKLQSAVSAELEGAFERSCLQALLLHDGLVSEWEAIRAQMDTDCPEIHPTSLAATATTAPTTTPATAEAGMNDGCVFSLYSLIDRVEAFVGTAGVLRSIYDSLVPLDGKESERRSVQKMSEEASAAGISMLQRLLARLLQRFFETPEDVESVEALGRVLRVYDGAGYIAEFRTAMRDGVLRPLFEQVVSWRAATQARQSVGETVGLLNKMVQEVENNIEPLIPLLRQSFVSVDIQPVSTILWPAVCEVLVKKLVSLYEVGIPDAFHTRYTSAYKLLSVCERCVATRSELESFRQSPDLLLWNHKWNVDVYAALRCAAVEKAITAALDTQQKRLAACSTSADLTGLGSTTPSPSPAEHPFSNEVLSVLCEQIHHLFSDDVFLLPCTPKFMRQALQSTDVVLNGLYDLVASGPLSDKECRVAFTVALLQDMHLLESSWARTQLVAVLHARAGAHCDPIVHFICSDVIGVYAKWTQDLLVRSVVQECQTALQNVKSVRSAYAHTRKPLPTAPSWYVATVMGPIDSFTKQMQQMNCPVKLQDDIFVSISASVLDVFASVAHETLLAAKKTEESWEKLRKKKEGSAGGAATDTQVVESPTREDAVSDRNKMVVQLYLDAKAALAALDTLSPSTRGGNGDPASTSVAVAVSAEKLFTLLRRAEWVLGASIPEPPDIEE